MNVIAINISFYQYNQTFIVGNYSGAILNVNDTNKYFFDKLGPFLNEKPKDYAQYLQLGNDLVDLQNDKIFGFIFKIFQEYSIILMVLNSIQPSTLPLFIKIYSPPNFYYVNRLFGLLIF